jgi:hypothetical protein
MADEAPSEARKPSKLRWLLGWIVLPGSLLAALFLTGVHLGARNPERPVARLLLKLFGSKPGVAASSESDKNPPREGASPGEPFRYSETLTGQQLQTIADQSLGIDVEELDCETVCRAFAKTQVSAPIYEIESCEFQRASHSMPGLLRCGGTFEAKSAE